jgi:PAS domain S-box-containing protein
VEAGIGMTTPDNLGRVGLFRSLLEGSPDCIMVLDREGRLQYVNRRGLELMELGEFDRIDGALWWSLWPPAQHEKLREAVESATAGASQRVAADRISSSGAPTAWDVTVSPLRFDSETVEGVICVSRDITEMVAIRAESARREVDLQRSLAALRSAGRIAKIGGWEVDFRTRQVHLTDDAWRMLGRTPCAQMPLDEALGFWTDGHHPGFHETMGGNAAPSEKLTFEGEITTGTGETIWLRVIGEPVFENGVCVALRGALQDITDERGAMARLESSESFARGILDGMSATICVLDERGAIISANRAWQEFRRGNERSVSGDGMGIDYLEACRNRLGQIGKRLARSLEDVLVGRCSAFEAEYPFHTPTAKRWVKVNAYRIGGDGPTRLVVMHQPITELKLSEQRLRRANTVLKAASRAAKAANESKSAFLATMSHEIRTPLNGVLGMAQAMANDELPERQRARLEVISSSGQALLLLLNDVLDLSKVEAGKLELEDGVVDLVEITGATQAAFEGLASGKGLHIGFEVAPGAHGRWRGDPNRVRQVLYNLVSNAVKFTDQGSVRVEISHDGSGLIMRVADTGPGISAEARAKLFQKFVQADASTTRRYGGSGLGLAICSELVALMGGEIAVDSVLGAGSTFFVQLPLPRTEDQMATPEITAPTMLQAPGRLRVLAAEDNPMNVLVLKTLLAQVGIEPQIVGNGIEAFQAWEASNWDLILMDVQMPVMDGPTAARRIRERERASGRIRTPIIALTANAMSHHAAEYTAAGMDALSPKPIDLHALLAAIDSVLHREEDAPEGHAACA